MSSEPKGTTTPAASSQVDNVPADEVTRAEGNFPQPGRPVRPTHDQGDRARDTCFVASEFRTLLAIMAKAEIASPGICKRLTVEDFFAVSVAVTEVVGVSPAARNKLPRVKFGDGNIPSGWSLGLKPRPAVSPKGDPVRRRTGDRKVTVSVRPQSGPRKGAKAPGGASRSSAGRSGKSKPSLPATPPRDELPRLRRLLRKKAVRSFKSSGLKDVILNTGLTLDQVRARVDSLSLEAIKSLDRSKPTLVALNLLTSSDWGDITDIELASEKARARSSGPKSAVLNEGVAPPSSVNTSEGVSTAPADAVVKVPQLPAKKHPTYAEVVKSTPTQVPKREGAMQTPLTRARRNCPIPVDLLREQGHKALGADAQGRTLVELPVYRVPGSNFLWANFRNKAYPGKVPMVFGYHSPDQITIPRRTFSSFVEEVIAAEKEKRFSFPLTADGFNEKPLPGEWGKNWLSSCNEFLQGKNPADLPSSEGKSCIIA